MRMQRLMAAVFVALITTGCGDRGATDQSTDQQGSGQNELGAPLEAGNADESAPTVTSQEDGRTEAVPTPARQTTQRSGSARPGAASGAASSDTAERLAPGETSAAAPAVPAPRWREVTIPAGTALPLELTTAVSTRTATVEMPVSARLRSAVTVGGQTVLPAGTVFSGEVIDVERPGRVEGRARLALRFTQARVDGELQSVRTDPITLEGEATKGEDATKIGAGAGIGAVVGGIIGGGDGAAKGAAIGGAAGTGAVLATRGRELELASGTDLRATVASPAALRVENR